MRGTAKGFTLFTALVSIILIVLAVLLAQSMIRTERNVTDTISDIQEQQEMQAMADLARADAMQVFNFGIRYQIEQYLTNPQNSILITPDTVTWNELVRDFAIANFGGTDSGVQFANRTANHLTNILGSGKGQDFKSFRLDLESNVEQMRVVLQKLFQESVKQDDFFEVIDCPNGVYKECVGTFYVNLNMSRISDEDYEMLPQIRVTNRDTGRVIKEPILPRSNFRIYVPLRIFKALAGAKALAHTPNDAAPTDSDFIRNEADYGLLSARIHNELEELKLGVCDPGSCGARNNPYLPAGHSQGDPCPGDSRPPGIPPVHVDLSGLASMGIDFAGNYGVKDRQSMGDMLREIIKQRLNFVANALAAEYGVGEDEGFDVKRIGPGVLSQVDVGTASEISKKIEYAQSGTASTGTFTGSSGYPNSPLLSGGMCPNLVEGVGAYFERDAEENWEPKTQYVPIGSCIEGGAAEHVECTEAKEFDAFLSFVENDDQYKVNKDNENTYVIRLHDGGLSGFTHRFMGQDNACALDPPPQEQADCQAVVATDWTCYSVNVPPSPTGGMPALPTGGSAQSGCFTQP